MIILCGLIAALGWGVGDLLARIGGRRIGAFRAVFFAQVTGLVAMTIWLLPQPAAIVAAAGSASWAAWLAGLAAAPVILLASYSLFRALTVGVLGVVSPVMSSYGAITAALAAASGEALNRGTVLGIALTVAGVALTSTPARRRAGVPTSADPVRGIGWALVAATAYGVGSWIQGAFAVPELGSFLPVWLYYATGVLVLVAAGMKTRQSFRLPKPADWPAVFGGGISSMLAYAAFAIGLATGRIAEVTVLSTPSSGIAALLGFAFLGERLARHQWGGVIAILLGIALINAGR